MFNATIQLLVYVDPDNPENRRLVRAPLKWNGRYVTVEDYKTGEKLYVHDADLEKV